MQIALESLSKRYSKVRALDNVSLEIEPGQIVSILGPNGAGKTTLLRCLSGIVAPTSGDIRYDEERFYRGNMAVRRRIAYLPDFPIAFPNNTVLRRNSVKRGRTINYSTQILDIAEKLSDRLCVMDRGQVRHYSPLAELQAVNAGSAGTVLEGLFQQLRESAQ